MATTRFSRRLTAAALVTVLAFAGAACGDDDDDAGDDASATTEAEETTTTAGDGGEDAETVTITAVEYEFQDVPDSVPAGTQLSLSNEGSEPHEIIALLIPESETRSVEEIAALSDEEIGAIFGGEPVPATVILSASGQTDTPGAVVGDGTLSDPGRYAIVCFLPVGADDSILQADGPPEGEFEEHVSRGMFAELTVE